MSRVLLILVNDLSFFISHRLDIAVAAQDEGFIVKVAYGELGACDEKILKDRAIEIIQIPLKRGSLNPLRELWSFINILKLFLKLKPDIVHLVTIKPYIYGGIAARLSQISCVVSAVAGLGNLFTNKKYLRKTFQAILYIFFRLAFNHSNQQVVVQNLEDKNFLVNWGVLKTKKVCLIKGSGVKLNDFEQLEELNGVPVVCFASRLLYDKGVYDFIESARIVKSRGIKAQFYLAGGLDHENPQGLKAKELDIISQEGVVKVLGFCKDIKSLYAQSHIICLPSFYGEGIPKSLIEAAAASRAIVTTDHPGCKDAVIPNKTGLLVPIKNPKKLADAIQWLIENPNQRVSMGIAGRDFARKNFMIEKIVQDHLDIYHRLLKNI